MWRPGESLRTRSSLLHGSSMLRERLQRWRGSCIRLDVGLWLEELASCLRLRLSAECTNNRQLALAFDSLVPWRTLLNSSSKSGQTLATRLALLRVVPRQRLYRLSPAANPASERVGELPPSRQSNREPTARATGGPSERRRMASCSHFPLPGDEQTAAFARPNV